MFFIEVRLSDMFNLFDKFLDFFLDVYICNSIGAFSIIAIIVFSIIEGILTNYYFKEKNSTLEDIKIYSLIVFRLILFVSTVCFRWWLAFILSYLAMIISKKVEKLLYEFKFNNISFTDSDQASKPEFTKIKTKLYISIGLIYFCIGLVFNSIVHDDIFWLI